MFATLLCLFALCPASLRAQSASSTSIAGVITDSSGAVVVGASVKLTDKATNTPRTNSTNDAGRYFFADVPSGQYEIAVSKTGFRITKTIVTASVGIPLTVDLKLELGSVSETVEVTATNSELQTMSATVGNTITGASLDALPAIGGDVSTFVALQPGVAPDGSVAGAVVDQSTFMLDGGNNTNDMDGSMQVYTPSFGGDPTGIAAGTGLRGGGNAGGVPTGVMPTPSDSVEEFKVNTANQTADFNNSAGAQVEVVTKRGTNAWHGTAYEYYLDNTFNANTWDNNASGTPIPSFHYNRFGGAVGGPIIPKPILGGKTYFFFNYQGFRWNNSSTIERAVPSADMRAGLLHFNVCNAACQKDPVASPPVPTVFNLKSGTNCGPDGTAPCDPRGIGINPTVTALWNLMPLANDPGCTGSSITGSLFGSRCDGVNEQGFKANIAIPQNDNFAVVRIDHDFGSKWHLNGSYRYYKLTRATTSQVDIGGVLAGTFGTPVALSSRPQQPWYLVAGLTTNITSNTTNDFHFSYLRNFWAWGDAGGGPQLAGLGGALEPLGESHYASLTPYNVDTQNVRTRFWDGHDLFFRDDLTMLKGNHLFQFGGAYQRNWDWHQRTDNGGGINYTTTYQLGDSVGAGLVDVSATNPAGVSSVTWGRDYAAVTGIVTDAQIAYTRTGSNLALNPPLTPAFDKSTIPYYNVYFSDSWHMKPSFTLTYGLGWTLEMPPTEQNGKQVELVDSSGQQLDVESYLNQRKQAALNGQVYNPTVGFALVGNTENGLKYPYHPFYGSFSPRIAAAWNPSFDNGVLGKMFGHGKSVVRGGYSRVYGRLNGVDLVLVPLLGTGLIQPVQCRLANMDGTCGSPVTAANAFRIGVDGKTAPIPAASPTLPQPVFPGINDVSAAAGEALDPKFRPNVVDSFDVTIQRQLTNKILLEVGYIGRRITHEYQPVNINAVPHMMTLGGQTFADAYAAVETNLGCVQSAGACGAAVPASTITDTLGNKLANPAYAAYFNAMAALPFFQAALAPTGYCTGNYPGIGGTAFANCTAAVASKRLSNFDTQSVWSLWSALDKGGIGGGPSCAPVTPATTCTNANGTVVQPNQQTTLPGFIFQRSMLNSPIRNSAFGANGQLSSGVGDNASIGHGNYNAGFVSLKMNDWHGVTLQQNFTYSKALGTGAFVQATSEYTPNDPFNLDNMYGYQGFDRKFVYNVFIVYDPPFYRSQKGIVGRALGGWSISPIFTAGSGLPLYCNTQTDAQAYGSGDGANFFDNEQCTNTTGVTQGNSVHNGVAGGTDAFGNSIAQQDCTTGSCLNIFKDPVASFGQFRAPILGVDTRRDGAGEGPIRGLPYWNVDLSVKKNIRISERFSTEFQFLFLNVFNHLVFANPTQDISNPGSWGVLNTQGNTPRQIEFGLRFRF